MTLQIKLLIAFQIFSSLNDIMTYFTTFSWKLSLSIFTDIDECSIGTDKCEQSCMNTVGGYICECQAGYSLDSNKRNCTGEMLMLCCMRTL